MSEHLSQSQPEKQPKTFLVARSNGEIQPGKLTNRSKIKQVLQSNRTYMDVTFREVEFPQTTDSEGNVVIPTKYVSEYALSDDVQKHLGEQLEERSGVSQSEDVPAHESNSYDDLFSDDYNESDYSNEAAANRGIDTESRRQEMLEYADVTLSGAMRNDTDLPHVIEAAFTQAGMQLPSEKVDLINMMRTDARVRASLQQYLREKAEYYRSDLPDRVSGNENKRPNYPGGVPEPSLEVAAKFAVSMIAGEWDQSREDGEIEYDAQGNVIRGQHRAAARTILMSPSMPRNK